MTATITTIPAAPVDATAGCWAIADEDVFGVDAAVVRHDFADRVDADGIVWKRRVEYLLPRRGLPVDFAGNEAIVNVDPAAVVRWSTFEDHLKAEIVFTAKPAFLEVWFAVNWVGVTVADEGAGLVVRDAITGEQVGRLPRPFLRDAAGAIHDLHWTLGEGCLTALLPDLDPALYVGAVFDPTTIDTSTASTAAGRSSQRTITRLSTGMLVAVFNNGGPTAEFWYSSDNGATWTQYTSGTSNIAGWANGSIHAVVIGSTEYLVVAWEQSGTGGSRTDGDVYLAVGTFNAGRTTLNWGTAQAFGSTFYGFPDLVAHPESTGGVAHVVVSFLNDTSVNRVYRFQYALSSSGVPSFTTAANINTDYNIAGHTHPSISLNTSTKDFFVFWHAGTTTAGHGIRNKKFTYSGGAWTGGTEREIDNANYALNGRISSYFDGTRQLVAYVKSTSATTIEVYERDAGDTTSTQRTPPALSDGNVENVSITAAANGDIWLIASGATSGDVKRVKFDRVAGTWGSWATLDTITARADSLTSKRGSSSDRIEALYADGASSPYNVRYGAILLNEPPGAPTWTTPAGAKDVDASLALTATANDPNVGDTIGSYALKRTIGGVDRFWRASDTSWQTTEQKNPGSGTTIQTVTIASGWGADGDADHSYRMKTWDAADAEGSYNTALIITSSAKVNPSIDSPADGATITTSSIDGTWTVAQMSAYRWRVLEAAPSTVELWSSGKVPVDPGAERRRTLGYVFLDGDGHQLELTTWNLEDLESNPDVHDVTVDYAPPATATLAFDVVPDPGIIIITVTNPAPTGGQPAVAHNVLYRRPAGETGPGAPLLDPDTNEAVTIPDGGTYTDRLVGHVEDVEYRVLTVGVNDTTSWSAWTA